jgi:outer membrane biosynthesis protein TonB
VVRHSESLLTRKSQNQTKTMCKSTNFCSKTLAIVSIATLMPLASRCIGSNIERAVVTAYPISSVASVYPKPPYPIIARSLHIAGDVRLRIEIDHGNILRVVTASGSPMLASVSSRWIRNRWTFLKSANGNYFLPITFTPSA